MSDLDLREQDTSESSMEQQETSGEGSARARSPNMTNRSYSNGLPAIPVTRNSPRIPSAQDMEKNHTPSSRQSPGASVQPQSAHTVLADSDTEGDDLLHRDLTDINPLTAEVKVLLPLVVTHCTAEIMLQLTDVPRCPTSSRSS